MIPLAGPPTSPADCVLAFAIPTTAADFVGDLGCGPEKDFARHVIGHRTARSIADRSRLYECSPFRKVLPVIDEVAAAVAEWGVRVVRDLKLGGFRELLVENRVVTLVTHSVGPRGPIEFRDGLHGLDEVVDRVPFRRGGILDLTLCYSLALSDAVKWRHPEWQVMSNQELTNLKRRLLFYKHKIKLLTVQPINYLDADLALRRVLAGFREI